MREDLRNRFIGGASLKYSPVEWADVEGNASFDRSTVDYRE